ncbi:tRNA1(Val) (adenine(37)-N6)-methyltransferase [Flocculibacter collagenilyticus]|uniref:tRNA1(Val) (adenine(37)-N6)-methyltransferase n=1 Tax=Flocculibacter collagenilyticus TaxID=2744479 RepID=UPI0018F57B45|nr:methyltransferase domain-containing protein [Flocculibacter collagenilyticus]
MNKGFTFKEFVVNHERCAMKVGTDGILLGAWAPIVNMHNMLDIGCGSGLISLMLAQRYYQQGTAAKAGVCNITAIDIDDNAVMQTAENVALSQWSQSIKVIQCNFFEWAKEQQEHELHSFDAEYANKHNFDLIISNPPFFNDSLISPDESRALARHNVEFDHLALLKVAAQLLRVDGFLAIILPVAEAEVLLKKCYEAGLTCIKLTKVSARPNKAFHRYLMLFSKSNSHIAQSQIQQQSIPEDNLSIYNENNEYSAEYTALTQAFYLKM